MRVFQRLDVTPIVKYHIRTLRAPGSRSMAWGDKFAFFGLPGLTVLAAYLLDVRTGGMTALLAATSLLVGAMLSVFVFLTNLRIKVMDTDSLNYRRRLMRLIGSAAVGSLYVAGVAMACAAAIALTESVEVPAFFGWGLRRPGTAIILGMLVHLVVTLMSVVRRIFAIYFDVFGVDFSADLTSLGSEAPKKTKGGGGSKSA